MANNHFQIAFEIPVDDPDELVRQIMAEIFRLNDVDNLPDDDGESPIFGNVEPGYVTLPDVEATFTLRPRTLTDHESAELARLEVEFDAAGGRGVELADRIDELRRTYEKVPALYVACDDGEAIEALCHWLIRQPGTPDEITYTWATWCDKDRADNFEGGAVKVTRDGTFSLQTYQPPSETMQFLVPAVHDDDAGVVYEPWSDGTVVGWKAIRRGACILTGGAAEDDCTMHLHETEVEYLVLNPSTGSDDGVPTVFVYQGATGDPAADGAVCHFVMFDQGA